MRGAGGEHSLTFLNRTGVAGTDHHDRAPVQILGDARQRRRGAEPHGTVPSSSGASRTKSRSRCRRVGTQARRARAPLRAHVRGPRPLHGLPVARRVGCALARDCPREPRPFCGPLVDVPRPPSRPAPGSTRRHPLRLPCSAERAARVVHRSAQRKGGRWDRPPAARALLAPHRARRHRDVARRTPASMRTSTSRRKPKPSSNGTPASSRGPRPPARAASNSTAPRRWLKRSQPGTPAACSPTSGQSPAPPRAPQADGSSITGPEPGRRCLYPR